MKIYEKYKSAFEKAGINTKLRIAHYMAQAEHESNLKPIEENLNYSSQGLANTWPSRYAVSPKSEVKIPNELAKKLHRKPEQIANNAYADRMGNGPECTGDGWRHRGRGFFQHTGRSEYETLTKNLGVDYIGNPDLLLNEADSVLASIDYWNRLKMSELADKDDIRGITRRINGGYIGLEDRIKLLKKYKQELGIK